MNVRDGTRVYVNVIKQVHCVFTGELLREEQTHNLVVDAGLNVERDLLASVALTTGIERFAIGTGTTAVASGNTALATEVFRGALTQKTSVSKSTDYKYYLASTDGNGNTFTEAGLFCNGATDTLGSGTLYARVLFTADAKNSAEAWTFIWSVSRVAS